MGNELFDAILVTGDRHATADESWPRIVSMALARNLTFGGILIHGDARGIDRMSECETEYMDRVAERYPANWKEFGKGAGHIRNKQMLDRLLDLQAQGKRIAVFAFHDNINESKGTKNMATQARKAGVLTHLYTTHSKVKVYDDK